MTSWLELFLDCFQDTTIIVLLVAAVVSLIVGTSNKPIAILALLI